mmetsp:Transcript_15889/g.36344  ORF Transcript_15889/g.36344 Transcript_15889/m.36344 type:complete len:233 (+) Transcript_15889:616-1314(+)
MQVGTATQATAALRGVRRGGESRADDSRARAPRSSLADAGTIGFAGHFELGWASNVTIQGVPRLALVFLAALKILVHHHPDCGHSPGIGHHRLCATLYGLAATHVCEMPVGQALHGLARNSASNATERVSDVTLVHDRSSIPHGSSWRLSHNVCRERNRRQRVLGLGQCVRNATNHRCTCVVAVPSRALDTVVASRSALALVGVDQVRAGASPVAQVGNGAIIDVAASLLTG